MEVLVTGSVTTTRPVGSGGSTKSWWSRKGRRRMRHGDNLNQWWSLWK